MSLASRAEDCVPAFPQLGVTGRLGGLSPESIQATADLLPHSDSQRPLNQRVLSCDDRVFCSLRLSPVGVPKK